MEIDYRGILEAMPHRYPFLLVDRILECEIGERVVGIKNVTFNEPFFQGHFPEAPVMPGVLIVEAMAQVGAVLLLQTVPEREKKLIYFMSIDKVKFRRPVVPGDQIRIEIQALRMKERICKVKGVATVDGNRVAEAIICSAIVDR